MNPRLLQTCARATTFPGLVDRILDDCAKTTEWPDLLNRAEVQGIAPLLHWHLQPLDTGIPAQFRRATRLLYLRHQHVAGVYARVLREALDLFGKAGIEALVLKGAALCQMVYPEIGLRPMRDIDLLLSREQAQPAQDLLVDQGFSISNAPRPTDHFHLPSLHKTVDGLHLCVELHHGLFPDCPPYYRRHDFGSLRPRAISFDLLGSPALTLSHEDMLWHIFQHGFHMPLTYEPFRLIAVADIITLVEKKLHDIDWMRIAGEYPEVLAALPLFHHLTPWREEVLQAFSWKTGNIPADVGKAFAGWPHLRLREQRGKGFLTILKDTFLPPEWWTRLYYGIGNEWQWRRCRLLTHPRHVLWWIRLYSTFLDSDRIPEQDRSISAGIRRFCRRLRAAWKKIA